MIHSYFSQEGAICACVCERLCVCVCVRVLVNALGMRRKDDDSTRKGQDSKPRQKRRLMCRTFEMTHHTSDFSLHHFLLFYLVFSYLNFTLCNPRSHPSCDLVSVAARKGAILKRTQRKQRHSKLPDTASATEAKLLPNPNAKIFCRPAMCREVE